MRGFQALFEIVPDPRRANVSHALPDILLIAFAAVLCGAETCVDIAEFGEAKREMLGEFVEMGHGTPSHDTFSRVFRLLDPSAFEAAFRRFTSAFAATLERQGLAGPIIAIDGKSLRGALDTARCTMPLHLVTAWAADHRLILSQCRAPNRSEVTAARTIIALLDLTGCIVTADALHASRKTASAIRARGGDYALVIKGNRGPLHQAIQTLLADPDPAQAASTSETAHGRYEERRAWVAKTPPDWAQLYGFEALCAVARIDSLRRSNGREQTDTRYAIFSRLLPPHEALRVIRAHWTIENQQHWLLDVAFGEDRIHTRSDHCAENLALLRRLALNLLQHDPRKLSIRAKIKRAGWSDHYLSSLLAQMR
ncbi:ISAs1 family transposase [Bosea sp. LjRoot237]|uniref:ISAs1 family transposase n=1 Tax=Bosea sp. LjRoot237 TaxID=3342292 RepID=UPI003ECE1240